jgi:hypothetical protein
MYELTQADMIWNRACGADPLRTLPGDRALADLLRAHGFVMNGGVQHAVESLTGSALSDALSAYRFYGFDAAASLLSRSNAILEVNDNLGFHEGQLDRQYAEIIPDDCSLVERFQKHLQLSPTEYAPLRAKDMT